MRGTRLGSCADGGSGRRGAVNGSRGAGQKCRVRSREAKWEGEVQRYSARGK